MHAKPAAAMLMPVLMLCLCVLWMVCSARPAGAQSLVNGGFEGAPAGVSGCANVTGQVAQGWDDNTCWDSSAPVIAYALDRVNPHSGLSSQRISLIQGHRVQFVQWMGRPVTSGTGYEGRLWLRGLTTEYVTVSLRQQGPPYRVLLSKLIRLTPDWREHVFGGVTSADAVVLVIVAEQPVTFWVDDASFGPATLPLINALPSESVQRSYFGMHFNYLDTPWPAVGGAVGAVRIWDAGTRSDFSGTGAQWSEINPARGVYDWSGLDARVTSAQAHGADVLMTLGGRTPRWASARPDETSETAGGGSPYGPGEAAEPANMQDWRDWVRAVATRYKGRIRLWEIWNEPQYRYYYTGRPHQLIDLWREAHAVLKSIDPGNRVLTPSGDLPYLEYMLGNGALPYADIINTHFYAQTPEQVSDVDGQNLQQMLRRVGAQGRPLWNSEAGWLDLSNPPVMLTQQQGVAYVARAYLLNWITGATRFYWYTWDNRNNQFAMREADGVTLTPAGRAYAEVARWMTGATVRAFITDGAGNRHVTLQRPDGSLSHAVWNPAGVTSFPVPATWNIARVRDLAGGVHGMSGTAVDVGPVPLLLEEGSAQIIIDNAAPGIRDGTRGFTGRWCASAATGSYGSVSLYNCSTGLDTYRWTPALPRTGQYDVYVWWTARPTRSDRVPVRVAHAQGVTERLFDQRIDGGRWVLHGRYGFNAGSGAYVEVRDTNGQASADAVRFVPIAGAVKGSAGGVISAAGGSGGVTAPREEVATTLPMAVDLIVDNAAAGVSDASRRFQGKWCPSIGSGYYGTVSLYSCGVGLDSYRWQPALPQAGTYAVYVRWTARSKRAANVPVRVVHATGNALRYFDQRIDGGIWVLHGRYAFAAGSAGYVEVSDLSGQASADAVRFVLEGGTPVATADPTVLFTDVAAGPVRGGPDNLGVPITVFGRGFGALRGDSKVTINGVEVARYLVWGQNNANNNALDMIVVQPGAVVSAGPVVVTVGGRASNATHGFTPTSGNVYVVAPTGSDAAPCSMTQPCASVLHASTNVMRAGDALLVRGGVMNDDEVWIRRDYGHSGTAAAPKIIRNYPGEVPVFSRGNRPFILDADYLTLSGIRFENRKSLVVGYETSQGVRVYNNRFRGGIDFDAIGTHGNDVVLAGNDCDVTGSTVGTQGHCYYISNGADISLRYNIARGAPGYGIHIFDQRRATADIRRVIRNVLVEGNLLAGSTQRSGMILAMGDEGALGNHIDGVTVRNNLFVGNNFAGIAVGDNTRNVHILHNTFHANGRQGVTIYGLDSVDTVELRNNLFDQGPNTNCRADCSWYQIAHVEKGAAARNVTVVSNFYSPGPPVLVGAQDLAARSGAAGFVDAAAGNLSLRADSAARDGHAPLALVPLDFDGRARPAGPAADAGAYEFR